MPDEAVHLSPLATEGGRMKTVAALFIDPKGPYPKMPGVECWDEARDARLYAGPHPVVAHPPCQLWVNLAAVNWKRYGRQRPAWYPGGDDGGCFSAALASVLTYGGVLEHPAGSHAWAFYGLLSPVGADGRRSPWLACGHGIWVCEVWQSAYGSRMQKRTWLVYRGDRAPADLNWERKPGSHQCGWFDRVKPTVGKREASATPPAFAEALVGLARQSQQRRAA